jgi:CubicO group peptidase (beta-lactamase class C family)
MSEHETHETDENTKHTRTVLGKILFVVFVSFVCFVVFVQVDAADSDVDHIFAKWNTSTTPGCAVGAAVDGKPVITKAYGMADLEHDVKIAPDTIFEAGSVSKQFAAAAILLLARDGKLSVDDPVRKYIPELPDFGVPLTIRHMLNHTSGLRDWGTVEGIAGWPRTTRAYTHAHVLEIVSHQKALNFTPGTRWSYSNTGFNLAAVIVSRASGKSFADFTRERLFTPVGMTHTSWRDDHTRVVKNRAIAYSGSRVAVSATRADPRVSDTATSDPVTEFHTDMPFEDVHGNGGLLTTVGDLLKWNENFAASKIADASFETLQQQAGKFNDGRSLGYAFGLFLTTTSGIRIVEHSGSTAGYSAHLLRMPEQKVSVAVLCNANSARATQYAHEVADTLLPNHEKTGSASARELPASTDLWRNVDNGLVLASAPAGSTWAIDASRLKVTDRYGVETLFERTRKAAPTVAQLRDLVGVYTSPEAETTLTVAVEGDGLVIRRRPDSTFKLTPLYADAFRGGQLGTVIFRRDGGRVTALSVVEDRVWDLRFARTDRSS